MAFFKHSSARHRAETPSHVVRNTTIAAAAAGAAIVGSVAPAQAYAEIPAASSATSWTPVASSAAGFASYTYQAPAVAQPTAAAAFQAPAAQYYQAPAPQPAPTGGLSPQSTGVTLITSASGIVATALSAEGTGYVWGGTSYGAWDCSGFTQWVYAQHGIDIPRTSFQQIAAATPTATPQPGDLVSQNGGNHIGIYLGGGEMISALNPVQGTVVHSVNAMPVDGYYTFR